MKSDKPIDVAQQVLDLFKKEQMLAFFDFDFEAGGGIQGSGLCKISKPREGQSKSRYFVVLFVIDTPSPEIRKAVQARVSKIDWQSFKRYLKGFGDVLAMPPVDSGSPEFLLQEADVYVDNRIALERPYVMNELYPAIGKTTGFHAGEIVFWEDTSQKKPASKRPEPRAGVESSPSLVERLKKLLGGSEG